MTDGTTKWDGFVLSLEAYMSGRDEVGFDRVSIPLGLAAIGRLKFLEQQFNALSRKHDAQTRLLEQVLEKLERLENPSAKKPVPYKKPGKKTP